MRYAVLISNGYTYEYSCTIEAKSVADARKQWIAKAAPSQKDFKVRRLTVKAD